MVELKLLVRRRTGAKFGKKNWTETGVAAVLFSLFFDQLQFPFAFCCV